MRITAVAVGTVEHPTPAVTVEQSSLAPSPAEASASPARGKYKAYTVNEKQAIVAEARQHGVRPTAAMYHVSHVTLIGWMKADFGAIQARNKKGARAAGGGCAD